MARGAADVIVIDVTHTLEPQRGTGPVPSSAPTSAAIPAPRRALPKRRPVLAPSWWRDLAGCLAWSSLLLVVALWVGHGGLQGLDGWAGWTLGLGRLSGLVASDLVLLMVVMMARVPFVERSYGQDELARRHRLAGLWSFNLIVFHVVTILLGYAATDDQPLLHEVWDVVVSYPGMLLAVTALGLFVLVVATSIRAARRRLRYESWHLLHLYAYLAAGLALPHQIWSGDDFVGTPWARAFWWTLYAGALAAVLGYRVGLPLWRSLRHRLVVERVVQEAPGVVSVHVTGRDLDRLPVAAGQFLSWRFLSGPGWTRAHPWSLSAAPTPVLLRITVKDLGDSTAGLMALQPGTKVLVEGPYGRLIPAVRTRRKVTLMASGIGITPIRALLEELDYAPGCCTARAPRTTWCCTRSSASSRAPGAPASSGCPVTALRALPGDRVRRRTCRTPTRCATSCPTSPSRTSTSAAPTAG